MERKRLGQTQRARGVERERQREICFFLVITFVVITNVITFENKARVTVSSIQESHGFEYPRSIRRGRGRGTGENWYDQRRS